MLRLMEGSLLPADEMFANANKGSAKPVLGYPSQLAHSPHNKRHESYELDI